MKNTISMTQFAATAAGCLGVAAPQAAGKAVPLVKDMLARRGMAQAHRALIYNPDAVGLWLFQKYTPWFAPVLEHTQLGLPVATVTPSWTPVCFGTMYTGVEPAVHGILKYEKHVLSQESLFDTLGAAGKKTALVAVEHSSMATLFLERPGIDYFILPYDGEVNAKAEELIRGGEYEVVVVYNQEYDDVMHRTHPESEQALQALKNHIGAFHQLCAAAEEAWKGQDSLVLWATEHGIHTNEEGHATHGTELEEGVNVMHFYGAWKGM